MSRQNQQELEQYFKQIKLLFPVFGPYEKRFYEDLKASVTEFTLLEPNYTLGDLHENFGDPKEIIRTYLASVDSDYMYKQIKRTKLVRRGVICGIVLVLLACLAILGLDYADYVESTKAIIKEQKTITYYEN